MIFELITLFPEFFDSPLRTSLVGKATAEGSVAVHFTNPRDFAGDKHRTVDDTPYGGGPGMVLRADVLALALDDIINQRGPAHRIALRPQGAPLTQATINRLSQLDRVVLLCGRYEGFDERIIADMDEEISTGDFVLSGGEVGALCIIDAVVRKIPGVMGNDASAVDESFEQGLLEYPHYTRPVEFRGHAVPDVLLSGNHEQIANWRRAQALRATEQRRPDLFARLHLTSEDAKLLASLKDSPEK